MTTVTLPWPDPILSPNARSHWAAKAKVTKATRSIAAWTCKAALAASPSNHRLSINAATLHRYQPASLSISMTFCPPDKRRRDIDNCISSTKAHRDGIADALGVDDSRFQCTFAFGPPVKGGAVHIEILPLQ